MKKGFLMALLAGLVAFSACEGEEKNTNDPLGFNFDGAWTCQNNLYGPYVNHRVYNGTSVSGEWQHGAIDSGIDVDGVYSFEITDYTEIAANEYYVTTRTTQEVITLRSQEYVDSYNLSAAYGITDWKINEARDITYKTFDNTIRGYHYTIQKIGEDGKMYFGKFDSSHNGTSFETRPVEYDTQYVWSRD
jgi:hypothetical protein